MEKQDKAYIAYCPLRNHLKKAKLVDSLMAIHSHINHQLFGKPLSPLIINCPSGYLTSKTFQDLLRFHLMPWEIEIIAKELIINAEPFGGEKSLRDCNYLFSTANKLKEFGNEISKIYLEKDKILLELFRHAHWQFKWQGHPNLKTLAVYWKIYSSPELSKVILDSIGISLQEIYLVGVSMIGYFLDNYASNYPLKIEINGLETKHIDAFLSHFCIDYSLLRKKLISEQEINDKYEYVFSSLEAFPLVKIETKGRELLICPITPLLFNRLTSGLYYEIVKHPDFDNSFGVAFQNFIGEVLTKSTSTARIFPEERYGKSKKRTVDWILDDETATLLIECKTKRLTLGAKTEIIDGFELKKQINIMAEVIVQVYKQIVDFKAGLYPQIKYDGIKRIYPVIVTLEEWYFFGDKILPDLDEEVLMILKDKNLPESLLKDYPYTLCSIKEIEAVACISSKINIDNIFKDKVFDLELNKWCLYPYLLNKFPKEIENIPDIFYKEFKDFLFMDKL